MGLNYIGDHPKRVYMIERFYLEILHITYFDLADGQSAFRFFPYKSIVRALVIQDRMRGTEFGMLVVHFGLTKDEIRNMLNKYIKGRKR